MCLEIEYYTITIEYRTLGLLRKYQDVSKKSHPSTISTITLTTITSTIKLNHPFANPSIRQSVYPSIHPFINLVLNISIS